MFGYWLDHVTGPEDASPTGANEEVISRRHTELGIGGNLIDILDVGKQKTKEVNGRKDI